MYDRDEVSDGSYLADQVTNPDPRPHLSPRRRSPPDVMPFYNILFLPLPQ